MTTENTNTDETLSVTSEQIQHSVKNATEVIDNISTVNEVTKEQVEEVVMAIKVANGPSVGKRIGKFFVDIKDNFVDFVKTYKIGIIASVMLVLLAQIIPVLASIPLIVILLASILGGTLIDSIMLSDNYTSGLEYQAKYKSGYYGVRLSAREAKRKSELSTTPIDFSSGVILQEKRKAALHDAFLTNRDARRAEAQANALAEIKARNLVQGELNVISSATSDYEVGSAPLTPEA